MASVAGPSSVPGIPNAAPDAGATIEPLQLGTALSDVKVSPSTRDGQSIVYEYPTTPTQDDIILSDHPQWCHLNLAFLLPFNGSTHDRILSSFQALAEHHDCLRTTLSPREADGNIHHRVLKHAAGRYNKFAANPARETPLSNHEVEEKVASLAMEEGDHGITVVLNIRRALIDSTSFGALQLDFALLYCGLPVRETIPMLAYIDHISSQILDQATGFWRKTFEGATITRATINQSAPVLREAGTRNTLSVRLDRRSLQKLSVMASRLKFSRKTFFESIWAVVLHNHGSTDDVVFAVSERDRSFGGYANCVGNLDQVYPLRVAVNDERSLGELADSVESFHNKASPYGHLGFESVLKESRLQSTAGSMLNYSDTICPQAFEATTVDLPLLVFVADRDPVMINLLYSNDLERREVELLLQHYVNAVENVLGKVLPQNASIDNIDLTSEAERKSILEGATSSKTTAAHEASEIPKLLEAQVRATPSQPAVQFEQDKALNFNDFNRLANRVARALQLKAKAFVPVCMDRSVMFLACLFAIMKAGAAYVVLDPAGASQRNAQIVEDCDAEIVLTNREYASDFKEACIIEDLTGVYESDPSPLDSSNLGLTVSPEEACYIIYTSGSTGAPKGVVLTHGAATSGMSHFSLHGRRRWLLFYNPIFSAAQRTMIATLVKGGCLLLASKNTLTTSLEQTINIMQADALGITPSALSLLSPSSVPSLKHVTLVGEQVSPSLLDTWCDRVELRNTFGLSECTQLNFGTKLTISSNPRIVGRPNDTTSAFILKQGTTELAPLGVAGELCLAGPQLGLGYLKNPEQTAKVFIDNPFGPDKLYRTGDVARQHHDGQFEIVGRLDFQVKINGQRTEPSEINEVLLKHPAIQACAAVVAEMGESKSLVCAVIRSEMAELNFRALVAELRAFLDKRLPSYMIPLYWLPVEELPKNANGKTDVPAIRREAQRLGHRSLLELLSEGEADDEKPFESKEEIALRDAWVQILGLSLDSVHHNDSFVTLGGSSIQAIAVLTELRQQGLQVELAQMISSSTLEDIAEACIVMEPVTNEDPKPFSLLKDASTQQRFEADSDISDAYPVTPLQEGLLAASLGGNNAYFYQRVWDLSGVDFVKLQQATQLVFENSDILRTTFMPQGKSYIQLVKNDMQLPWSSRNTDLAQYKQSDKEAGIAVGQPLFRVAVVQDKYLVVSMHHSLFDFWSHRFLYQDVAAAYYGQERLQRPRFSRFAKHVLGADAAKAEAFWKEYLADGNQTTLNHATTDEVAVTRRDLAAGLSEKAKGLGITMGALVYASWALVLSRHTNARDISFATTLSGREAPIPAIDRLDGPTLTTIPQRVDVDGEMPALDYVKRVAAGLFEVMKFSQHGMRKALSAATLPSGFCDTLVNVLAKDQDDELSQKLFKRHGPRPAWTSEYTTLEAEEVEGAFQLRISGRLESRRSEFLLESTALVMEAILEQPQSKVGQIGILGDSEREFLVDKERIERVFTSSILLQSRFEDLARSEPDKEAIDWDSSRKVTYRELNHQADRVASYLHHTHGIDRGDIVPLLLDKSVETIVVILGVMKAGAAYVPLSPDNPVDRNGFIIRDVGCQILLTQDHYLDFSQQVKVQTVSVASILACEEEYAPVDVNQSPEDIAYVIYTSGSTGNPKGVKVTHRSSATAVTSMLRAEERDKGEWRTLQFANYVFDASVQDIFNTLSSGGTLCMAPTEKLLSELPATINEMDVKQAIITPTVAKLIRPEEVPGLEHLIVGGEPLTSDIVEKWAPSRKIHNVYGPTETSMVVTTKDVRPDDNPHNVGKPFESVVAFIMNRDGTDLVPYGAVGELCIAGPQLAEGYVNNETATNDAFMACEWLGIERMYKTGDLARWYPNGDIECLGRKDNQVKIHGHRIELGEVEQAITRTGIVQDTAVVASSVNDKLQLTAFAVFDANESEELEQPDSHRDQVGELKQGLKGLAPYMVPKSVLRVGKLPKLLSGKVDRQKLKKWVEEMGAARLSDYSIDAASPSAEVVPTSTEEEAVLEKIWADIAEREPTTVGAMANFFALGGDSVSAINLVSTCRAAGYSLSVGNVFKYPVLRELAMNMKKADANAAGQAAKQFTMPESLGEQIESHGLGLTDDVEYTYPAPPGQVEFLNQGQKEDQYWILMTIRPFAESIDVDKWIATTTELTRLNAILRTFFVKSKPNEEEREKAAAHDNWIGVVLKQPEINISFHDCPTPEQRIAIIEEIWQTRFAFGKPWIQYAVLNMPDGKRDILIKMDHSLYDGTLLRLFDEQFVAIQHGTELPPREDFKDFVMHVWRADKAGSLAFWREYMAGKDFLYPGLPSASSAPSSGGNASDGAMTMTITRAPKITAQVTLPTDISLDALVSKYNVTPSIVFQTAFQLYLMRKTGATDVSFDYLLSGRNIELANPQLINGNLAGFLPFRSRLSSPPPGQDDENDDRSAAKDNKSHPTTLAAYLEETQRLFWEITEHGNVGLDDIYDAANNSRAEYGNRALFLFQPFEPPTAPPPKDTMKWVVMKGSEVRMYQPYALVMEVSRTLSGHLVKIMFDEGVYDRERAQGVTREVVGVIERMVRLGEGGEIRVEEFLKGLAFEVEV